MVDQLTRGEQRQRVQIGNLPDGATEATIRSLLLPHGEVLGYMRPVHAATRRPGAIAYVDMTPGAAAKAIAALNGHRLGDARLEVGLAAPAPAPAPAPSSAARNRTAVEPAEARGAAGRS